MDGRVERPCALAAFHYLIQAYSTADGLQYVTDRPPVLGTPLALAEDRAGRDMDRIPPLRPCPI